VRKYVGYRDASGDTFVYVIDETHEAKPLDTGLRYVNHSATGFSWGYLGSGPAQLAFAILLHHLNNTDRARSFYQDFKFSIVGNLPQDRQWELTSEQIDAALAHLAVRRHVAEVSCRDIT